MIRGAWVGRFENIAFALWLLTASFALAQRGLIDDPSGSVEKESY
jgi:hypothetical protein